MTDVDTLTLAEFLLARIAEDEARVKAPDGSWPDWGWRYRESGVMVWSDDRALAECEAKRKIVELHHRNRYQPTQCAECGWVEDWEADENGPTYPCVTLQTLAAIYADHPDYREGWDERRDEPEEVPGDHLPPRRSAH